MENNLEELGRMFNTPELSAKIGGEKLIVTANFFLGKNRWFALNQAIKYHGGFYDGESHSWEIPKIIATKSLPDFKSIHEEGLKLAIIAYQKFAEEHYKSPKSAMIGFG